MVSAAISLLAVKRGYALEVLYADLVVPWRRCQLTIQFVWYANLGREMSCYDIEKEKCFHNLRLWGVRGIRPNYPVKFVLCQEGRAWCGWKGKD
jgi:hypothetical protein